MPPQQPQPSQVYTAAVVEYAPTWDPKDDNTNTRRYVEIIKSDQVKEAEIIVFPENTLISDNKSIVVPRAEDKVIPCGDEKYSDPLKSISCAAKEAGKYVVVQLYMQRKCKDEDQNGTRPCQKENEGINIYNTAVALDRTGTVVGV